jgi:hypothetical protein
MDDMIADIGMEYELGSGDQHPLPEVQNFLPPQMRKSMMAPS